MAPLLGPAPAPGRPDGALVMADSSRIPSAVPAGRGRVMVTVERPARPSDVRLCPKWLSCRVPGQGQPSPRPRPLLTRRSQDKSALAEAAPHDAKPPHGHRARPGTVRWGDGRERKGLSGSGVLGGARAEPHSHTGAPGSRENSCPHSYPGPAPYQAWPGPAVARTQFPHLVLRRQVGSIK